jgi:uncharacterized membrane protein
VFESENAARQGVQALRKLDEEGRIELYKLAAIRKNADGTITRLREDQDFPAPSRTLAGAALGSLLGLLGGGVGFAVGAGIGALICFIHDVHTASVDTEYLSDVSSALTPGSAQSSFSASAKETATAASCILRRDNCVMRSPIWSFGTV